jgi:uroporphyrinogen-III decarboxylase
MSGLGFDQMARSGEAMAEAQLAAWREFRHDVIMHEIGVCAEAEAMGARVHYQPDQPPHVAEPLITRPEDIEKLRVPDPETTYPLNELLKGTRILAAETRGQVHINGRADQGPIALALALCGPEQFLEMLMEPGMAQNLLNQAQRHSGFQQVGGVGMAQGMHTGRFIDTALPQGLLEDAPQVAGLDVALGSGGTGLQGRRKKPGP